MPSDYIFVAGQSIAARFLHYGKADFAAAFEELSGGAAAPALIGHVVGGSLAASSNAWPAHMPGGKIAWWNVEEDRPAQPLVDALDKIAEARGRCRALLFDLGQSEGLMATGRYGRSFGDVMRDFRSASTSIVDALRAALSPGDPQALPVLYMVHGPHRRADGTENNMVSHIRRHQQMLVDKFNRGANWHSAGDLAAMDLEDTMHPSSEGVAHYAREVAASFLRATAVSRAAPDAAAAQEKARQHRRTLAAKAAEQTAREAARVAKEAAAQAQRIAQEQALVSRRIDAAAGALAAGETLTAIATTGNCQSLFLASVLTSLPGVHAEYFGKQGRFHPFEGHMATANPGEGLLPTLRSWKAQGYRVILCEQTWAVAEPIPDEALDGLVDGIARFPSVEGFALWPDRKYTAEQLERLSGPRLLRLDLANIRAGGRKANVVVDDVVEATFRSALPFDSERHPTALLLSEIIARIVAAPAFDGLGFDRADLKARVAASRGLNTAFNHPVADAVIDGLDLAWGRTQSYRLWAEIVRGGEDRSFAETMALLERFLGDPGDDPFFVRMITPFALSQYGAALWRSGDREGMVAARRRAVAADPYSVSWHTKLVQLLMALHRLDEAQSAVEETRRLIPASPAIEMLAGEIALKRVSAEAAREYFVRAVDLSPNNFPAIKRLFEVETVIANDSLDRALGMIRDVKMARVRLGKNQPNIEKASTAIREVWAAMEKAG